MPLDSSAVALIVAGVLFVLYLLLKLRFSFAPGGPEVRRARQLIQGAKAKARASASAHEKAEAWREAAVVALEQLKRPNLAASFARRAERADPQDEDAVRMIALSLRKAGRLKALERLLWRRLAQEPDGVGHERAFEELLALYRGPMKRLERATVLARLRATRPSDSRTRSE